MNIKSYRNLFIVFTLILSLIVASPLISNMVSLQSTTEKFTELWLLDSKQVTENYPSNVSAGELYTIYVDLANHMRQSEYYLLQVKLGNVTQYNFTVGSLQPSSLDPLYERRFFVADEGVWESPVTFGFQDVSIEEDVVTVGDVVINDVVFPVDALTSWNSEKHGYYFNLFFELWRYDTTLQDFAFDNRVVGLRLNMTTTQESF